MADVTQILEKIEAGDHSAANDLLPLVYEELRQVASAKLAQERPGQTLEPTALVHEAFLRLVDNSNAQHWNSRRHFFAAAAEAMRRILVENARRKMSQKHGGQMERNEVSADGIAVPTKEAECLELDDLLDELANVDQQSAELVKLRYFVGMTMDEAAEALGISPRSAYDTWSYARSWLKRQLRAQNTNSGSTFPRSQS